MMLRTKSEQKAYLNGFEMCAECIEKYLTNEGKQKLEGFLMAARSAVEIEDVESQEKKGQRMTRKERGKHLDCISREQALEPYKILEDIDTLSVYTIRQNLAKLPSIIPQESKAGQFAEWVAREIFDDMWEYNKDAFAEITCRKLAKLGIVRENGNEWELVELQEGSDTK